MIRMRRRTVLGSGLALAATAPAWCAASDTTAVALHGRLRVADNRIVDARDAAVQLAGMSLFWSQWMRQYYNADVIRWLRDDWRVSVVRAAMAVHGDGYLAHPARERAKIDAVIQAAIDLGIYVIVDWHAHQPEPDAASRFFGDIARTYGRHANIIYEPYNEPLAEHGWAEVLKPYHARVADAIRTHDAHNLIVAGTRSWSQDVDEAAADPLDDANTAYTLHFYAGTHRQDLRDKAQKALDLNAALFVTEWGTSEANGNDTLAWDESRRWLAFLDARGISRANWSIADKNETSAALRPGAAARGEWTENMLSPSGRLVRAELRARRPIG